MTPATSVDIQIFLWVVGGLLSVLVMVVSWGVNLTQKKVEGIAEKLGEINLTLAGIERDLRGELAGLDRRVGQLQTAMRSLHPEYHALDGQ